MRCLRTTTAPPPKSDLPSLLESFKKTLEDSDAAIRAASADALGTMMKVIGERAFLGLVGEVDALRMEKVKESFEKAETKCRDGRSAGSKPPAAKAAPSAASSKPKARPPPPSVVAKAKPPPSNDFEELEQPPAAKPPVRGPPARLLAGGAKKPPPSSAAPSTSAPSAPVTKKPALTSRPAATSAAPASSRPSEPLRYKFNQESAESQVEASEAIPANLVAMLADSAWKVRLEGIEKLADWVKLEGRDTDSEIVVRWLVGKKPGPKESNFQVRDIPTFTFLACELR